MVYTQTVCSVTITKIKHKKTNYLKSDTLRHQQYVKVIYQSIRQIQHHALCCLKVTINRNHKKTVV